MIVLGLDISTSITGYCLMDTEQPLGHRLIEADGLIISHKKDSYTKSVLTRDVLLDLGKRYDIERVIVEENLQAFRRGLSSAKTLSTLARFNGIVCFLAQDTLKIPVEMINVNTARAKVGLKVNRKIEDPIKDQIVEWVKSQPDFSNFKWPTKKLKSGPRKGMTVLEKKCYDIADAAVVCLSAFQA